MILDVSSICNFFVHKNSKKHMDVSLRLAIMFLDFIYTRRLRLSSNEVVGVMSCHEGSSSIPDAGKFDF